MQAFSYEEYAKDDRFDTFVKNITDIFCRQFENYQLSHGYSHNFGYRSLGHERFDDVEKTGEYILNMVTDTTAYNYMMIKRARAAILQGFKESEALYGDYLPSISYRTLEATLAKIDNVIAHF